MHSFSFLSETLSITQPAMRLAKRFHRPSLLATTTFLVLSLLVNLTSTVNSQVTFLDKLGLPFLRSGREFLFKFAGATGHNEADFRTNLRNNVRANINVLNDINILIASNIPFRNYRDNSPAKTHSSAMSMGLEKGVPHLLYRCINCGQETSILSLLLATV